MTIQTAKRKRGRPRKITSEPTVLFKDIEPVILFVSPTGEIEKDSDLQYHTLLPDIIEDPKNYREAISRPDGVEWSQAVKNLTQCT